MKQLSAKPDLGQTKAPQSRGASGASPATGHLSVFQDSQPLIQAKSACACGGDCPRCAGRLPIQTKLKVSEPRDAHEQEADHVADQIMRMPEPTLQRSCATCVTGNASCPECDTEKDQLVQRAVESHANHDQLSVNDTFLNGLGPGHPMDPATRAFMEPRFGHDFGDVRLHTDAGAAESAAAIDAQAYSVGRDVVFGAGYYAPANIAGQRLLAHELTHVLQSRASSRPAVRRQAATSSTTLTVPPNVCNPGQSREIAPAVATAQQWLRTADTRLTTYMGAMAAPGSAPTGGSLLRHFAASDAATARYVQNRIRRIADLLRTDASAPSPLTVQCHTMTDLSCGGAAAYVLSTASMLVFCPSFFGQDQTWQIGTMIHEIAHSLPPASGPLHITDRAYRRDRLYGSLSPGEALTNAESYALLVQDLATTTVQGTAPRDTFEDCPTDWRAMLFRAMALVQQWTHNAQNLTSDRRPGMMSQWATQATTFLGGQSAAQMASAASDYRQMTAKENDRVDFECEVGATGGRCATSETYWYAFGDYHICPLWRALPTDDDRAESLMSGLFGYWEILDNSTRRRNLARLARAVTGLFWAVPTAADVSGALTADAATPQPPAAPAPGPRPAI